MSAFVKGLKKPPACIYYDPVRKEAMKCQCLTEHDTCCLHDEKTKSKLSGASWSEQYAFCPITDIPTPHGRLIDADKLLKSIEIMKRHKCETCEFRIDTKRCSVNSCWMMFIAEFIEELPSVIEAEVE